MTEQLSEKMYAITGGSQGFGLAIAKSLAAQGARVSLLSSDPAAAEDLLEIRPNRRLHKWLRNEEAAQRRLLG